MGLILLLKLKQKATERIAKKMIRRNVDHSRSHPPSAAFRRKRVHLVSSLVDNTSIS